MGHERKLPQTEHQMLLNAVNGLDDKRVNAAFKKAVSEMDAEEARVIAEEARMKGYDRLGGKH
ncbi:hypothetical protein RM190_04805 [Paracoccus sp. CPCC 101403]|uniref:Uncharacterized protein n=1 Tax=Paracoccus broussonetiae TaxID=3075834 RepID=A0ABU3EAB5_9RHOB|nr:hypothetical protein [Paracoccus sp. CPCC 101403]MDT1061168.1 hypothetical protein [Paracoccus sp. CPCC 101403]